jgi:CMP-N-acetylneuraminic acid synthetase
MKRLAVIPARSGSKGIKDKNIKLLAGIPLIGYTIKAALESNMYEKVMVSTDSPQYAKIAKELGAEVPFLRNEITSQDTSTSWDVIKEVVNQYEERGHKFDLITLLQPTSPLRDANDIIGAHKLFAAKDANSVISVCEAEHSPLWSNIIGNDLSMEHFAETDDVVSCRQELSIYYRENGAIYIINDIALNNINNIFKEKCYAYIMAQSHSIDIDSELDFMIAEAILNMK